MAAAVHEELSREPSTMTLRVESLAQVREAVQKKTFTRWANMSLPKDQKIGDLFDELKSGITLLNLVNNLSNSDLRPERGKLEIHQRANIGRALDALAEVNPQHGISISAIYEGSPKLTLALLWHLILNYSHLRADMDSSGVSADVHCRQWCGKISEGYVGLENIGTDFLGTWVTGLVLPALINRNDSDLIDYEDMYLNKTPEQRFEISFDIIDEHYSVPKLLDVEDMTRARVDEQSVTTYLMALNKTLLDEVPEIPQSIVELGERVNQTTKTGNGEMIDLVEEELTDSELFGDDDLTPVGDNSLPQIIQQREKVLSTTPEQLQRLEDKDSGLEESPMSFHDKVVLRESAREDGSSSQRGSTITVDSESEYISAHSSPIGGRKTAPGDQDTEAEEGSTSLDSISPRTSSPASPPPSLKHSTAELEATLQSISSLPTDVTVTVPELRQLQLLLKEKGEACTDLQKQIHAQLNWKQEREKRADLHQLLTQTGHIEDALSNGGNQIETFIATLEQLYGAMDHCQAFTEEAEEVLSEEEIPGTAEETRIKLVAQHALLAKLEEEQRNLEYAFRSLNRSIPQILTNVSIQQQQREVSKVQNGLSDMEAVLNGSVDALSFLSTRLPSLEQKLHDADEIITITEDKLDKMGEGGAGVSHQHLQLQIDRANTHLGTVHNLFLAIESFSAEFNLQPLREQWLDLTQRANRSADKIASEQETEDALSEEVVMMSDWADKLEQFLQMKIKPIESRKQLREVQGKWKEVAEDLLRKCDEIEELLQSDYTTHDQRVMSPLDKDTLLSLRNQLHSLRGPLHVRRELLQEAYSSWGRVEAHIKSLSMSMLDVEFGRPTRAPPVNTWSVLPLLSHLSELRVDEAELREQREQLQTLLQEIGDLPGLLIDTCSVNKEQETLLNKHSALCKRATNKRIKCQRACLTLKPVVPWLRASYLDQLSWLYHQPLLDIESSNEANSSMMIATLSQNDRNVGGSWHVLRTIAPAKIPLLLVHWLVFAFGPLGMGCSTDRPLMISDFTPDILI